MMMTMTFRHRREISMMLVLGMAFSFMAISAPTVHGGLLRAAGSLLRGVVVNGGALAAGYMGAVLGIALGGGPIGMVAGAVGGFIVGRRVLNWTTASVGNVATVGGAVAGALLTAGMGFPILAAGVIGGALVARFATHLIGRLFRRATGRPAPHVDLARQDLKAQAFIDHLSRGRPAATPVARPAAPARAPVDLTQGAYEKYLAAYKAYLEATKRGNAAEAKRAHADYKRYLALYNASLGRR